jgi:hypothetical protein
MYDINSGAQPTSEFAMALELNFMAVYFIPTVLFQDEFIIPDKDLFFRR